MSGNDARTTPSEGERLPELERTPDAVDLFMFSASSWLVHRIHYDHPYTTDVENHPGLLVHGPLQGVMMARCVTDWLAGRGRIRRLSYRHLAPVYVGSTLVVAGRVVEVEEDGLVAKIELEIAVGGTAATVGDAEVALTTPSPTPIGP